MAVNHFLDKMVLVPIERWNQLLEIEKNCTLGDKEKGGEKSKQFDEKIEKATNTELNIIPPGIPEDSISKLKDVLLKKKTIFKKKKRKGVLGWKQL